MNSRNSVIDIIGSIAKYVVIIICILFFISKARDFYKLGYGIFAQQPYAAAGQGITVSVEITDSMRVKDVAALLKRNGLIGDADVFVYQEKFSSYHGEIKAGTYTLSSEMTADEMLAVMAGESSEDGSSAVSSAAAGN